MPDQSPAPKSHWLANLGLWLLAGFSAALFLATFVVWLYTRARGGFRW